MIKKYFNFFFIPFTIKIKKEILYVDITKKNNIKSFSKFIMLNFKNLLLY